MGTAVKAGRLKAMSSRRKPDDGGQGLPVAKVQCDTNSITSNPDDEHPATSLTSGKSTPGIIDSLIREGDSDSTPNKALVVAHAIALRMPQLVELSIPRRTLAIVALIDFNRRLQQRESSPSTGGRPPNMERDIWIAALYMLAQRSKPKRGVLKTLKLDMTERFELSMERVETIVQDKVVRALAAKVLDSPYSAGDVERLAARITVRGGISPKKAQQ